MSTVTDLNKARAKRDNIDLLFQLTQAAKGPIRITINEHRVSYYTVEQEIKQFPTRFKNVHQSVLDQLIEANTLVEVKFHPTYPGREVWTVGSTVEQALHSALSVVMSVNPKAVFADVPEGYNHTELLAELGKTCRASVYLTANEFEENKYIELQAYTLTPIGFASVTGIDLGYMLTSMLDHAKTDVKNHPVK